jgi:hypothetical protein
MPTYTKIASNTVGAGGVASVTFSSIPNIYTDLLLKISARSTRADISDIMYIRFNGDTGGNYNGKQIYADGAGVNSSGGADTAITFYANGDSSTANIFGSAEIVIPNYLSSNFKSVSVDEVTENNGTYVAFILRAGIWSSTAAITSLSVTSNIGIFKQHSTFTLYGISNA